MDKVYLIEVSICLVIVTSLYFALFRKSTQIGLRRAIILFGIIASLSFPMMNISYSDAGLGVPGLNTIQSAVNEMAVLPELIVNSQDSLSYWWMTVIGFIYILGVMVTLTLLINQLVQLVRLILRNRKEFRKEGIFKIAELSNQTSFSFFRYIFIERNPKLSISDRIKIIDHEKYHSRELHSLDLILLEVLSVLFWFHPGVWIMKKELKQVHEYLADNYVSQRSNKESYSALLSRLTLEAYQIPVGNYFKSSQTLNRLKMINTQKQPVSKWKLSIVFAAFTMLFVTFACTETSVEESVEASMDIQVPSDVVTQAEVMAQPVDGMNKFYGDLVKSLKYPEEAKEQGIEGKVFIEFIVDKNGDVVNPKLVKGIGAGCDEAALEAFKQVSSKWSPAEKDGKTVNLKMVLPVTFALAKN